MTSLIHRCYSISLSVILYLLTFVESQKRYFPFPTNYVLYSYNEYFRVYQVNLATYKTKQWLTTGYDGNYAIMALSGEMYSEIYNLFYFIGVNYPRQHVYLMRMTPLDQTTYKLSYGGGEVRSIIPHLTDAKIVYILSQSNIITYNISKLTYVVNKVLEGIIWGNIDFDNRKMYVAMCNKLEIFNIDTWISIESYPLDMCYENYCIDFKDGTALMSDLRYNIYRADLSTLKSSRDGQLNKTQLVLDFDVLYNGDRSHVAGIYAGKYVMYFNLRTLSCMLGVNKTNNHIYKVHCESGRMRAYIKESLEESQIPGSPSFVRPKPSDIPEAPEDDFDAAISHLIGHVAFVLSLLIEIFQTY